MTLATRRGWVGMAQDGFTLRAAGAPPLAPDLLTGRHRGLNAVTACLGGLSTEGEL
jgi:hypothetical protein